MTFTTALFAIVIIIGLVEISVQSKRPIFYYYSGLPILSRVSVVETKPAILDSLEQLIKQIIKKSNYYVRLHSLDIGQYGLSVEYLRVHRNQRQYASLMHGVIHYDYAQKRLSLTVYLNWAIIPLFILILGFQEEQTSSLIPLLFRIVFGCIIVALVYQERALFINFWEIVASNPNDL